MTNQTITTTDNINVGDRVRFKTIGGWYNSGIVKEVRKETFLVEVDRSPATSVTLPYLVAVYRSKHLEKIQEMYWRSIKDKKPPDGERVILCMKVFGWHGECHNDIFIGVYDGDKNITHWMPRPEEPSEKSPNYEVVDFDTAEIKEVDPTDKREWKKKGENEMTIGEFCNLVYPEPESSSESIIFMDENGNQECQMKIGSSFLKKFFWDKTFKSVSAEGTDQFGIWGLED